MMSTCYPYQYYSCPVGFTEWSPIVPVNPIYTMPIPIIVNPTPMLSTSICPYVLPAVIPPVVAPMVLPNHTSPLSSYHDCISDLESPANSFYGSDNVKITEVEDTIDYYLSLPKDLFPSARMMMMDPNDIIEEFCRLSNVYCHAAWILDLEFGIPKSPITRPIPCYNVKFNSIHCKNTPEAIHPGFESCSQDFKRVLLFYYDCIVSVWYRSYVFLNCDKSVENFQTWLMLPMQELGMCWS